MAKFEKIEQVAEVAHDQGLVVVSLLDLREALGYKKLGVRVLDDIVQALRGQGLGYFPREVLEDNEAPRQWDEVRVFDISSNLGKVVKAIQEPSEKTDRFLLEISEDRDDAAAILDRIRTLLDG